MREVFRDSFKKMREEIICNSGRTTEKIRHDSEGKKEIINR